MEISQSREPWNKGKLIGQKPPLKLKDIWAIRIHLQFGKRIRDLAMFNWPSIANCEVAIWSTYESRTLLMANRC
jgi:hypothetical protein